MLFRSHFSFDILRQTHADAEVDVLQLLLDFLNGFLAAVPMFEQFGFGLFNEFEDMLDLQGFENVDGANGELEGIDSLAQLLNLIKAFLIEFGDIRGGVAEAGFLGVADEDGEMVRQDARGLFDGVARIDTTVCPDRQFEAVIVGVGTDAAGLEIYSIISR